MAGLWRWNILWAVSLSEVWRRHGSLDAARLLLCLGLKKVTADTVCGCRCVLCVYALRHNPVCVYKCVSDFRGVQMMESIFATVFQNYFPWDLAHFLLWKLLHYQYKTHLDLKHCMSTQSRSHVHGQWSSSKLFISLSSQIRISAPWFSCLWKLTHNNLQYKNIL